MRATSPHRHGKTSSDNVATASCKSLICKASKQASTGGKAALSNPGLEVPADGCGCDRRKLYQDNRAWSSGPSTSHPLIEMRSNANAC